jgi:heparinase II/III-like protein
MNSGRERYDCSALTSRLDLIARNAAYAERGRQVVEESVYEFNGFTPVKVDLLNDWSVDPLRNRSWQWNTASFNFMPWLLAHYGRSAAPEAPDFALAAIDSWRHAVETVHATYEFSNHDHATALRTENVLLLLCYLVRNGFYPDRWEELANWLDAMSELLEDDSFYSRYTNHGIEQSRILAMSAYFLVDRARSADRWQLAMTRLQDELDFSFTSEGVHVENSPGYHVFVCNAFLKIAEMFPKDRLGVLGESIAKMMPKAMTYIAHIVRPDGKLPIIGDTEAKTVSRFRGYEWTLESSWLAYTNSGGVRGRHPRENFAVFPEAGYLIVRDRWRKEVDPPKSLHLMMKSGYLSRYHRHDDDLNIVLYWGEDWLVDGGGYSYAEASPVRRYLRSKWAHNVPVVDDGGDRWPALGRHMHATSLQSDVDEQGKLRATATTGAYRDCLASRTLEMSRGRKSFIVHDRISPVMPGASRLFRSLWHVPDDKDIYRRNQDIMIVSRRIPRGLRIRNIGERFGSVSEFVPVIADSACALSSQRTNELTKVRIISFNTRAPALESRLRFDFTEEAKTVGWTQL